MINEIIRLIIVDLTQSMILRHAVIIKGFVVFSVSCFTALRMRTRKLIFRLMVVRLLDQQNIKNVIWDKRYAILSINNQFSLAFIYVLSFHEMTLITCCYTSTSTTMRTTGDFQVTVHFESFIHLKARVKSDLLLSPVEARQLKSFDYLLFNHVQLESIFKSTIVFLRKSWTLIIY